MEDSAISMVDVDEGGNGSSRDLFTLFFYYLVANKNVIIIVNIIICAYDNEEVCFF